MISARRGSHWNQALRLFSTDFPQSPASIGALMSCLASSTEWEKCLELLLTSSLPDAPAISSTILACEQGSAWATAMLLVDDAARMLVLNLDSTALLAPVRSALHLHQARHGPVLSQRSAVAAVVQGSILASDLALAEQESALTLLLHVEAASQGAAVCRAFNRKVTKTVRQHLAIPSKMGPALGLMLGILADLGPVLSRDVLCTAHPPTAAISWRPSAAAAVAKSFAVEPMPLPSRPLARRLRIWLAAGLLIRNTSLDMHEVLMTN